MKRIESKPKERKRYMSDKRDHDVDELNEPKKIAGCMPIPNDSDYSNKSPQPHPANHLRWWHTHSDTRLTMRPTTTWWRTVRPRLDFPGELGEDTYDWTAYAWLT